MQVVGPVAAGRWLKELGPALQLRYSFLTCRACAEGDAPEIAWLRGALGDQQS